MSVIGTLIRFFFFKKIRFGTSIYLVGEGMLVVADFFNHHCSNIELRNKESNRQKERKSRNIS